MILFNRSGRTVGSQKYTGYPPDDGTMPDGRCEI